MFVFEYLKMAVIFIVVTLIIYTPIFFILKKKEKGLLRQSSYMMCFYSFFFVIFVTIIFFGLPISFNSGIIILNLKPFAWLANENIQKRLMTEIVPNIMVFIPLGFFVPIVFKKSRKFYKTALSIFIVTFSIEFFQYFIGRSSDVDDLISNLTGGIIGYGMFRLLNKIFKDKKWWNNMLGENI